MSEVKSKKDIELFKMIELFKNLNERERGYVLGLAEGFNLCKVRTESSKQINANTK